MKNHKKRVLIVLAAILVAVCVVCAVFFFRGSDEPTPTTLPENHPTQNAPTKPTIPTTPTSPTTAPTEHVHQYDASVVAPGCEASGYTVYVCECGDSYIADQVEAVGHSWGEWTEAKSPTETQPGEEIRLCAACGEEELRGVPVLPHSHDYVDEVVVPTCTEGGFTRHECACGDTYVDTPTEPIGHAWGDWTATVAPTEETPGEETRQCTVCGTSETQQIPALGHIHNFKEAVWEATCLTDGCVTMLCTCGESYIAEVIPALGHEFLHYESNYDASCEEDGTKTAVCTRCDVTDTLVDVGSAAGHSYTEIITKPTCTEPGHTTYTCEECGNQYTGNVVSATGHAYNPIVTKPTCTAGGYTTYTCKVCDHSYTDNQTAALGHQYGAWDVTVEATCAQKGQQQRSCSRCNHTENKTTDIVPCIQTITSATFNMKMNVRSSASTNSTVVGSVAAGETIVLEETKTTSNGQRWGRFSKGWIRLDGYAALTYTNYFIGSSCTTSVIQPTCSEDGYTQHKCDICGKAYYDQFVAALGHSVSAWEVVLAATCTASGEEKGLCYRCGKPQNRTIEPLNGIIEETRATIISPTVTIYTYAATGRPVDSALQDETYVVYEQKTDDSGKLWGRITDTKPYLSGTSMLATVCDGWILFDENVQVEHLRYPVGHILGEYTVVEPSCSDGSVEESFCMVCGTAVYREIEGRHAYTAWTTEYSCLSGGSTYRFCIYCGLKETIPIPAGHEWEYHTILAPTETEEGRCKRTCAICDKVEYFSHKLHECSPEDGAEFSRVVSNRGPDGKLWTEDDAWEESYYCYVCESYFRVYVCGYHQHEWGEIIYIEPTCLTHAREQKTCIICGVFFDNEIMGTYLNGTYGSPGHIWSPFVITQDESTSEVGYKQRTCSTCGNIEGYAIPMLHPSGEPFKTYIDDGVGIREYAHGVEYSYKSIDIFDYRDWDGNIIIRINEDDGLDVAFNLPDGTLVSFRLRQVKARDVGNAMGVAPRSISYINADGSYDSYLDIRYWSHIQECPTCKYPYWYLAEYGELCCISSCVDDICRSCGDAIQAGVCHHCTKVELKPIPAQPPLTMSIDIDELFPWRPKE